MNIYKMLLVGAVLAPLSMGLGGLAFAAQNTESGEAQLTETQEAANTGTVDADQATDSADNDKGTEKGEVNDPADKDAEG